MNLMFEQVNAMGEVLVRFGAPMLVQSSVLMIMLLLADFVLRKKVRAVFRYWLWMLVLVKLVLPSSMSSPVSVGCVIGDKLRYVSAEQLRTAENSTLKAEPLENAALVRPSPVERFGEVTVAAPPLENVARGTAEHLQPPTTAIEVAAETAALSWQGLVFLAWLAVVVAMGLLLLQRAFFVRQLVAQARQAKGLLVDSLEFCRRQMGVKTKIELKVSSSATSPAVCGLFRPVILLPANLAPSLGSRHLRAVLMHELAHIKRGDLWVNLLQTLLQIVYFYNLLLWVANAVIRRVREQAVDETVLVAMGEKARWYPETLVSVAKLAFERPALSLRLIGVVESKNALAGRIKRILTRPMPRSAKLGIVGLVAILAIAVILLPMAMGDRETDASQGAEVIEKVITPEHDAANVALNLRTGEFIKKPEAAKDAPLLSWSRLAGPAHKDDVGLLAWNMKLDDVRRGRKNKPQIDLWMVENVDSMPGFLFRGSRWDTEFIGPTSVKWPYLAAFKGADGTIGVLKVNKVENGMVFVSYKLLSVPEQDAERTKLSEAEFKAILSNGVTVELVGVCEHPSEGKQWWQPDGNPLVEPPYASIGGRVYTEQPREFAVRLTGLADSKISHRWEIKPSGSSAGGYHPRDKEGKQIKDLWAVAASVDEGATTATVRFGVASGDWQTHITCDGKGSSSSGRGEYGFNFSRPYIQDGRTHIVVSDNLTDSPHRVIAVDKNGHRYEAADVDVNAAGNIRQSTFGFENLPVEDIKEFRFQTRPYQWVEFKNVYLVPQSRTVVGTVPVGTELPRQRIHEMDGYASEEWTSYFAHQEKLHFLELQFLDENYGKAVPDVYLRLGMDIAESDFRNQWIRSRGRADRDGKYRIPFPDKDPKSIQVSIVKDGYVPMFLWWQPRSSNIPAQELVELAHATRIAGSVKDCQGQPVEGATLEIWFPPMDSARYNPDRVTTDSRGQWQCDTVPENLDGISIRVYHPNYPQLNLYGRPGEEPVVDLDRLRNSEAVLVLPEAFTLEAIVVNETSKPIQGACVYGGGSGSDSLAALAWTQTTDHNGEVSGIFKKADIGKSAALVIRAAGYAPKLKEVTLPPPQQPVRIVLNHGGRLHGLVVDTNTHPIENATVRAVKWGPHSFTEALLSTRTEAQGRFFFDNAPLSTVKYSVAHPDYLLTWMDMSASENEYNVALKPNIRINGTVTDAETGAPIKKFRIIPSSKYDPRKSLSFYRLDARTFEDGNFQMTFRTEYEGRFIGVEADGYTIAVAQILDTGTRPVRCDFKLNKNNGDMLTRIPSWLDWYGDMEPFLAKYRQQTSPANESENPHFRATLPNGVTVELVGICENPSQGKQWWRPDGSILRAKPYEKSPGTLGGSLYAYEFVYRVTGGEGVLTKFAYGKPFTGGGGARRLSETNQKINYRDPESLYNYVATINEDSKDTDLTILIGNESQWQTVTAMGSPSENSSVTGINNVIISAPVEKDGKTCVDVVASRTEKQSRVVAIDKDGKQHIGRGMESSTKLDRTNVISIRAEFSMPLKRIKSIEYQTQRFIPVIFKNVSLKPGVKSDVKIEIEGTQAKAKVARTKYNLKLLHQKVIEFKLDSARYPTEEEGLCALTEQPSDVLNYPRGGYVKRADVLKDAWGHEFYYERYPEEGGDFRIVSWGADGEKGGEGYNQDLYSTEVLKQDSDVGLSKTQSPLHLAVLGGRQETAQMLLSQGFDVNAEDSEGNTPLHIAAANGHLGLVGFLIERGANVNAVNNKGQTPLHLAAGNGHVATAELLIKSGAGKQIQEGGQDQGKEREVFLLDVDETHMMLDLATAEMIEAPEADSPDAIWQAIERLGKGDLVYEQRALIFVRGASADVSLSTVTGDFKRYEIGKALPEEITVTTKEDRHYRVVIEQADDKGCKLRWRYAGTGQEHQKRQVREGLQGLIDAAEAGSIVTLPAKKFVAEHVDDTIYLKPLAQAKLLSVPMIPADVPLASIENKELMAQKFFQLKNYGPSQMANIIVPLIDEYGYVSADESTGKLLVIDTVENLIRISRVIDQFDIPEAGQVEGKVSAGNGHVATAELLIRSGADEEHQKRQVREGLQGLIDAAEAGSVVTLPAGVYTEPITIDKPLILKGESVEKCVFQVTSNGPAIFVKAGQKGKVVIEDITVKWQLATSERSETPFAVAVQDCEAQVRNCRFYPLGNFKRCPVAIKSLGFSKLRIESCLFEGFEYTVCFGEGSEGSIADSIVAGSGHQGISLYSGATAAITGNVVCNSRYHGVRSTGGTLDMRDNLVMNNANRGVYLGNKSAHGVVENNVIMGSGLVGVSGFAQSDVNVRNNLIMDCGEVGVGLQPSCRLVLQKNVIMNNPKGVVVFIKDSTSSYGAVVKENVYWNNEFDTENCRKGAGSLDLDPGLRSPEAGDFGITNKQVLQKGHGLTDPAVFQSLWQKSKVFLEQRQTSLKSGESTKADVPREGQRPSLGSKLAFRVAAKLGQDLSKQEFQRYCQLLDSTGPGAGDQKYKWFEIRQDVKGDLPVTEYKGKRYVLLCSQPKYVMSPDQGWGLAKVDKGTDNLGRPMVKLLFDEKGAALFYKLTSSNISKPLAIAIDGKVVSAPTVMTAIRRAAVIVGTFSDEEVEQMVETLRKGMPPVDVEPESIAKAPNEVRQVYGVLEAWFEGCLAGGLDVIKRAYSSDYQSAERDLRQMRELLQMNADWRFSLVSVMWDEQEALAVSSALKLGDPKVQGPQMLVWTLAKFDGRWGMTDIDLEEVEGLQRENSRFFQKHPNAQVWFEEPGPHTLSEGKVEQNEKPGSY